MFTYGVLQIIIYCVILVLVTKPAGIYLACVFDGKKTILDPVLKPLESLIYRFCGIDSGREMKWTSYAVTMLAFNLCGIIILYGIMRLQSSWLNPQHFKAITPDLAFNTAVSFVTNTNWQAYSGEQTMSYLTQMLGLTWQNFVSTGTGLALAISLIRGLTRQNTDEIGSFWVDLVRSCLYILLPVSVIVSLFFVGQGVIQNFSSYITADTLEGTKQVIAQGPTASQLAIKMLGTNGGGFFNANSAHPYENPTPLSNFVQMFLIFLIPAGLTYTFGLSAKNTRQGWSLFSAMLILFLLGVGGVYASEQAGNPLFARVGIEQGGNMEGKEVRFGIAGSSLFAVVTTAASCGAVNCSHDSLTPLGGGIVLLNIALGELIFGGVGAGLLGIIIYALLAVFIAGLMVGRTPEYLGKKIQAKEMKLIMLAILVVQASILVFSALAVSTPQGLMGRANLGPHGLSEILYAMTSAAGNNGSAFGGLSANTPFYNTILALAMLIGRFLFIIPVMAIAGSMAQKKTVPESSGTFPTTSGLFVVLLVLVILVVGALTFFPAYSLGPIVEHFLMQAGKVF